MLGVHGSVSAIGFRLKVAGVVPEELQQRLVVVVLVGELDQLAQLQRVLLGCASPRPVTVLAETSVVSCSACVVIGCPIQVSGMAAP